MKRFSFILLLAIGLIACQKEIGTEFGTQNGSDSLLYKIITNDGTTKDSALFLYNTSRKLIGIRHADGTSNRLSDANIDVKYDANGKIVSHTNSDGVRSIVFSMVSKNNKYSYKTATLEINGEVAKDSIVYQYDASGRISATLQYDQSDAFGIPSYLLIAKAEYTYDSRDNISKITASVYDENLNKVVKIGDYILTYDTKKAPLKLGNEAIVLEQELYYNTNNLIKTELVATDPTDNITTTSVYTYNSASKPVIQTMTESINNTVSILTYIYK